MMVLASSARSSELLERDEPLAALHAARTAALTGQGRLVLVGGEAGVGKTSLVRRLCAEVDGAGGALWGTCDSHRGRSA
jgi:MoxR-like ATPase